MGILKEFIAYQNEIGVLEGDTLTSIARVIRILEGKYETDMDIEGEIKISSLEDNGDQQEEEEKKNNKEKDEDEELVYTRRKKHIWRRSTSSSSLGILDLKPEEVESDSSEEETKIRFKRKPKKKVYQSKRRRSKRLKS